MRGVMERQYRVKNGSSLIPVSRRRETTGGVWKWSIRGNVGDVIVEIDSEAKNEAATKLAGAVLCET